MKVLIADDNALTLRSIQVALEVIGLDVVATSDPRQVPGLAMRETVDAVVLDVLMPEMSGYDVIHLLRCNSDTAEIPVVFLSGLGQGGDRVRGLREGADDYLVKPFEPAELALRLERLVARRRARSGAPVASLDATTAGGIPAGDVARLEVLLTQGGPVANVPLGRYQVLSFLGEGGTGTVLRCWDSTLHRTVALKTIRLSRWDPGRERSDQLAGLLQEAVAAARVQHPNIVAVFDIVDAGPLAFIVMEFVNGLNLERYIRAGKPLSKEAIWPLAAAIARPLAVAHANRIIHRDLKPSNVLLGRDGSVKVSDFGIATFNSCVLEGRDQVFGTPGFVPPECLGGRTYDEKGDLFALGVTLYLCATGISPFVGATLAETVRNTLERDPPPPSQTGSPQLAELDDIIMTLIARERARRPASAALLATQLERASEHMGLRWTPAMAVLESGVAPVVSEYRSRLIPSTGSQT